MYCRVLVGYEDRDQGRDALALGRQLADTTGAELVVGGVFPLDSIRSTWTDRGVGDAEDPRPLEDAARSVGAETEAIPSSSPARGLRELAEETGADLVVVGSSHRGRLGRVLAGTVGTALLHGAACAVAVAPRGYRHRAGAGLGAVVVGFDGSAAARQALLTGWQLAGRVGVPLELVSVAVPPAPPAVHIGMASDQLLEAARGRLRESLAEARGTVPAAIDVESALVTGDVAEMLADAARGPGTILIVGSRGYGSVRRVLLCSVSSELVRRAPCPVVVTPRGSDAPHGSGRSAANATTA
jgi:nucleotide-binding universal stress UspA family protein